MSPRSPRSSPRARTQPATRPAPRQAQQDAGPDAAIAGAVERWFGASARDLPWRTPLERNAYHALVSEAMLQQTQVSRVIERFRVFIERFPTVEALAAADEGEVLGLWSGLGYYRRARSLHSAAKAVVAEHGGRVPSGVDDLLRLPGVGRYTAGAIASIAYGERAPIVDGNVARVLLRLRGKRGRGADPTDPQTQRWLWRRAGELVNAAPDPAAFNEGLMELGATVCTPQQPRCAACPLQGRCAAWAEGSQGRIPTPKPAARTSNVFCASVFAADAQAGRLLVEQRPAAATGSLPAAPRASLMWAGMWQAPTLERTDRPPTGAEVARFIGVPRRRLSPAGSFTHKTTHRIVRFDVWVVDASGAGAGAMRPSRGQWLPIATVETLGLSNPQRRILLGGLGAAVAPRSALAQRTVSAGGGTGRRASIRESTSRDRA